MLLGVLAAVTFAVFSSGWLYSQGWRDYVLSTILPLLGVAHLLYRGRFASRAPAALRG